MACFFVFSIHAAQVKGDYMTVIKQFWRFGMMQAQAALFGGILLIAMLAVEFIPAITGGLHRYDFLFLIAVLTQVILLLCRLESWREVKIILVFHLVATGMEIFKTAPAIGSWAYPGVEDAVFTLFQVPLFAGFMYSAVGSYIVRAWRLMDLQFTPFPKPVLTLALSALIYVNFFTHHFIWDMRYLLLLLSVWMFIPTMIDFNVFGKWYRMPFICAGGLTAFFIWVAENIGTYGTVWVYPAQSGGWQWVSFSKLISWYMLLLLSFGLVSLLHHKK